MSNAGNWVRLHAVLAPDPITCGISVQIGCEATVSSCRSSYPNPNPSPVSSCPIFIDAGSRLPSTQDQRLLVVEIARACRLGQEVQLRIHALLSVADGSAPQYVLVLKAFHLIFVSDALTSESGSVSSFPPRSTQFFESVFLSAAHAVACVHVAAAADGSAAGSDPLHSNGAAVWADTLRTRGKRALQRAEPLVACRAYVQLAHLRGKATELPDVLPLS